MATTKSRPNRRLQLITLISKLNLYSDEENLPLADQHLSTRLYIIFLSVALFILILFSGFSLQTFLVTVNAPSLIDFEHLTTKYPLTLSCACSQTTIPYKEFLTFRPQYHQVCSSGFTTEEWISSLFNVAINDYHPLDFRVIASAQFQVLASLCRTIDQFVSDAIQQSSSSFLITKQTLSRAAFDIQVAARVDALKANTLVDFYRIDQLVSTMIFENRLVSALRTNFYMKSEPNFEHYGSFSSIYSHKRNLSLLPTDNREDCSCEYTLDCTFPSGFYNSSEKTPLDEIFQSDQLPIFLIPGMQTGCLPRQSLLQSTLECFFDQVCLNTIIAFVGALRTISPLNATAVPSRFPPTMTVGSILDEMMIESWHNTSIFADYFRTCAPSVCSYSYSQRWSFVYMVTILVGLIGGLNAAFLVIAPLIVTLVIRRLQTKFCRRNDENVFVPNDRAEAIRKTFCFLSFCEHVYLNRSARSTENTFHTSETENLDVQHVQKEVG